MKIIAKQFKSLKAAEKYQNKLYGKYDYVRAIRWPMFSEEGIYAWEVRK